MPARPSQKLYSLGRRFLALLLVTTLLAGALLSASPYWHESLHHDASASHACLVTLQVNGHCLSGAAPAVLVAPVAPPSDFLPDDPACFSFSPALFFTRLEHAPPIRA